jgi:hypothetical protein
VVSECVKI